MSEKYLVLLKPLNDTPGKELTEEERHTARQIGKTIDLLLGEPQDMSVATLASGSNKTVTHVWGKLKNLQQYRYDQQVSSKRRGSRRKIAHRTNIKTGS